MGLNSKQSVNIIPNWLFKRYVYIWIKFKDAPFTAKSVKYEFKKTTHQSLKELHKNGWLICNKTPTLVSYRAVKLQEIMESIYIDSFIFSDK